MLQTRRLPLVCVLRAGALALSLIAGASHAQDGTGQTLTVEIVDRTDGRVLPVYWHEGRRYIVGRPGNEYAIRVRSACVGRVLAVMSVDGVNVITGDTASPQQSGYVLGPYESADIGGWRKSLSHTAVFYFAALRDSYAARTGRPENVGVIGVAVYRERVRPIARDEAPRREVARAETPAQAAAPAPAGAAAAQAASDAVAQAGSQRLGTGHGRSEPSYASYTRFERASDTPTETIVVYYDSYENLLAQGVPLAPPLARIQPNPFPDGGRFVPDPVGR